ncbi:DUF4232 domain-containing protein [Streptomyces sp. NPDC091292]|uniref:DUF4232 domain-containing protein n=1 Tax=Streptomyces sp. NPDC091292 TaxID=3365991 RepID=UPI0037FA8938
MRVHKLSFAVLALAAGLTLTACQNGDDGAGAGNPSAESTASSSGGGAGSGGSDESGDGKDSAAKGSGNGSGGQDTAAGNGSSANGSNASGKVAKCTADELVITATDNTIGGDPDLTVVVEMRNGSSKDCSISGYAGVDLKTNAGPVSAARTGQETVSTILKSGEPTFFPINYPANDSGGSGVRITGLVVTPPDDTKSVTLDWPGAASLPVTDGSSGSQVKIGPMGSAGQGG